VASLIKELSALPDVDLKKRVYVVFNGKPLHKKKKTDRIRGRMYDDVLYR
jgi:hypothetical protein